MSAAAADSSETKTPDEFWGELWSSSDRSTPAKITIDGKIIATQKSITSPHSVKINLKDSSIMGKMYAIHETSTPRAPRNTYVELEPDNNDLDTIIIKVSDIVSVEIIRQVGGKRRARRKTRRTRRCQSRRHR